MDDERRDLYRSRAKGGKSVIPRNNYEKRTTQGVPFSHIDRVQNAKVNEEKQMIDRIHNLLRNFTVPIGKCQDETEMKIISKLEICVFFFQALARTPFSWCPAIISTVVRISLCQLNWHWSNLPSAMASKSGITPIWIQVGTYYSSNFSFESDKFHISLN